MKDIYQMAAGFRTAILKAKANREFSGDGLIERFPGGNCSQGQKGSGTGKKR